jgi:peptide/nickel transport system substrate-binding protein
MEPINSTPPQNPNPAPTTDNVAPSPGPQAVAPSPGTANQPPQPPAGPQPKSKKKLLLIVVVLLLVLGGGAAAYFAMKGKDKSNQPAQQAQSAKKPVELLTVGVTQPFFTTFYPKTDASIFPIEVNAQIFEGLTKYQNENQIVPNLATSWSNPDNNTWDFKLTPGVKFHNGHDLTPQAVKASLDALATNDYAQPYLASVKSVSVKGTDTVEIKTSAPDALLPTELANVFIYDTTGKANDPGNGTGPYTLKTGTTLDQNSKSIDLVAVNDYHGGTPMTKEVVFKSYTDDKVLAQDVKDHKVDIADLTSKEAVDQAKQYGYVSLVDNNPQVYFLLPNTQKAGSPLSKLAVRKAIYEGLDPNAIMKADGRTGTPATQFVPQDMPGYNPDVKRPAYNATQAKSDLAAAGYPNGFTITFTYFATHDAMAKEVQKEMAAMGVKLTMDAETSGPTLQKKALGGGTDLFYIAYGSSLIDSTDVIQPLLIDSPNYKNADLDKIYQQVTTTFNTQARLNLMQQMNKQAMDDVAGFPLFVPDGRYLAVKSGLAVQVDNLTDYLGIDFWKVYEQ